MAARPVVVTPLLPERHGAGRSWATLGGIVAAVLLLLPAPARPSCQTVYCRQLSAAGERSYEQQLHDELARDPSDLGKWQRLLMSLDGKPWRERFLARYAALYEWEPQPLLEIDLEARLRRERDAWLSSWKQAFPDLGEPWCAEARAEAEPAARVALLRRAADLLPADAVVHDCLAGALVASARQAEAQAVLEGFRDLHPDDPRIHDALVGALRAGADLEALRAALEARARRFPDNRRSGNELLAFYDQNGLTAQRDRLLAELASGNSLPDRTSACDALRGHGPDSRAALHRCRSRVLMDFADAELDDSGHFLLAMTREALLTTAARDGDWAAIRSQLAAWPIDDLADAWRPVVGVMGADGCRALLDAWSAGELRATLAGPRGPQQASRLAWSFSNCGEAALADEVERPFVADASDDDLAGMDSEAARVERSARAVESSQDSLARRRADDEQEGRPLAQRLPLLQDWLAAAPDDPEPALRLSALYADAGSGEEAVQWMVEAASRTESRPGDGAAARSVDLRLRAAALALGLRRHREAAAIARQVLAWPASPRQHAEAHYLIGRVALREGRREEAAGELLHYFPLRLRYTGCCGVDSCDHGLLQLLLANGDLPRLRVYLAERAAAAEWFNQHLQSPPIPTNVLERHRGYQDQLTCLSSPAQPPPQPELGAGCRTPGTLDYLAVGGAGAAPAGERDRRRREVTGRPACPPEWLADPEARFADEPLLGLAASLTFFD
jgi:hypothetical protein